MEVMDQTAGRQAERIFLIGLLLGWLEVAAFQERPAGRVGSPVLHFGDRRSGEQVMAVRLGVLDRGPKAAVSVKAFGPAGMLRATGPLDTPLAQHAIAEPGVIAEPALGTLFPGLESRLRILPGDQRPAVLVFEFHPSGVVQPDIQIAARLPGWVD